ncbi:MAG TPA: flavodoxin family protein [Firmicutes bacterium]|jgi:multimeric flavodoxin WrbA|nr:flavodoxin family protein [Bacillota bacterium]
MLILGLAGSPRRNGNTEILLDEALAGAKAAGAETEKIVLSTLKFSPCISCGNCEKTGNCILQDDMQAVYEKIIAADVMIFATPNYFYNVSAWAKAAIDRSQALWSRKHVLKDPRMRLNKPGYMISVGATKGRKLFKGTMLTMQYFFEAAGYKQAGSLLIRGVDAKGDILKYPDYLNAAVELGREAAAQEACSP